MPAISEIGLRKELQKVQEQNEEIKQKQDQILNDLKSVKTEFGIALGQVLKNQDIAKPIQDEILKFTDEWFGTKFTYYGFPQ